MRSHILAGLALVLWVVSTAPGFAQATTGQLLPFESVLDSTCRQSGNGTTNVISAWTGVPVDRLSGLSSAAAKAGLNQLKTDLAAAEAETCLVAQFEGAWEGNPDLADLDGGGAESRAYLWAAEIALELAGCAPGPVDGRFDVDTAAGWNRARSAGADIPAMREAPAASAVVALLHALRVSVCDVAADQVPIDPTGFMATYSENSCGDRYFKSTLDFMAANLATGPVRDRATALFWRHWCAGPDPDGSGVREELPLLLARGGIDVFKDAPPDAQFDFGTELFASDDEAERQAGLAMIEASGTPGAAAFLYSAKAAGQLPEVPASAQLTAGNLETFALTSGGRDYYYAYFGANSGLLAKQEAARLLLESIQSEIDALGARPDTWLPADSVLAGFDTLRPMVLLAGLVTSDEAALAAVLQEIAPRTSFWLASLLFEGHAAEGRSVAVGMRFLERAAEGGFVAAQYRLGIARLYGFGAAPDEAGGTAELEVAAKHGSVEAMLTLAGLADGQVPQPRATARAARKWYLAAFNAALDFDRLGELLSARIAAGSPFLSSEDGRTQLLKLAKKAPGLARTLGEFYLCADCGSPVNRDEALYWLRQASTRGADGDEEGGGSGDARLELGEILLLLPPDLQKPGEAAKLLEGVPVLSILADRSAVSLPMEELRTQLTASYAQGCETESSTYCITIAHDLAIGRYSTRLAAIGLELLQGEVERERVAFDPQSDNYSPARAALIDVEAFYGDFAAALELVRERPIFSFDFEGFNARNETFRRLVQQLRNNGSASPDPNLADLLAALQKQGDLSAKAFALLLDARHGVPDEWLLPGSAAELKARYDRLTELGGLTRGLATSARSLAAAYSREADQTSALRYELLALQIERRLNAVTAIKLGLLPSAVADACALTRASDRVKRYGYPNVALVLARTAVNRLQGVRRELAGMPQTLQNCFSEVVTDTYRALASLLVSQDRLEQIPELAEALKDYEQYAYFSRTEKLTDAAFPTLEMSADEEAIIEDIDTLDPPPAELVQRRSILRGISPRNKAENKELEVIETRLREYGESANSIIQRVAAADRTAKPSLTLFRRMQSELAQHHDGKAVALYYFVLPDRMYGVLVTPTGVLPHTWNEIDGQPFTEAALNARIGKYRASLVVSDQEDALTPGRQMYDLLVAPFRARIDESGAREIYLSLDRQLRFVPFAALRDPEGYLVQSFDLAEVTAAGLPTAAPDGPPADMVALGVSEPQGYPALPAVDVEVDGLVADSSGYGLLPGETAMNDDVTLDRLTDAVVRGAAMPGSILHLASHFLLGSSDQDSFLVLGQGQLLTTSDLGNDLLDGTLDLGGIGLVTLSACETAYAPKADASQLESLAGMIQGINRNVIASLWSIADRSTALFMLRFYELRRDGGLSNAEAMSAVMREFIGNRIGGDDPAKSIVGATLGRFASMGATVDTSAYAHPHYWAPFVLFEGS